MGNTNFQPPPESTSLQLSTQKCARFNTLSTSPHVQNLVMITSPHFPPRNGENAIPNNSRPLLPSPFLLYSCSRLAPKRLNWFGQVKHQNAWFGVRKCLFMIKKFEINNLGVISPKNYPKIPPDAEIPAKFKILKYSCNFWTNWRIFIKFEMQVIITEHNYLVYLPCLHNKIQDGGGRHLEFR